MERRGCLPTQVESTDLVHFLGEKQTLDSVSDSIAEYDNSVDDNDIVSP